MKKVKLNNGAEMPILGFGVFQVKDLNECESYECKPLLRSPWPGNGEMVGRKKIEQLIYSSKQKIWNRKF